MNDLFNLTWNEARALALAGTKIRRFAWQQWLSWNNHLWWITENGVARVVDAPDFGGSEFIGTDWTTADWTGIDVCSLNAPGAPPFTPPAVSATAILTGGNLVITALLGAATYGSYWLTFYVNGTPVYAVGATQSGAVQATVTAPGTLTSVEVRIDSVLPLPAWTTTVNVEGASFKLVISNVQVIYVGANPLNLTANGSIITGGTLGQETFTFGGTIGDFAFWCEYNAATNAIVHLYFASFPVSYGTETTFTVPGYGSVTLGVPKTTPGISVPQWSGALQYDEYGTYDVPPEGSGNTSRTDSGSIMVVPAG